MLSCVHAGKNQGGSGVVKQCSLCKKALRDGRGHRAPTCPYRDADAVEANSWEDGPASRFAATAMENEARAKAAEMRRKSTAAKNSAAERAAAAEEAAAAKEAATAAAAAAAAALAKAKKKRAKEAEAEGASGAANLSLSPHELLLRKGDQREEIRLRQLAKQDEKRKAKRMIFDDDSDEGDMAEEKDEESVLRMLTCKAHAIW